MILYDRLMALSKELNQIILELEETPKKSMNLDEFQAYLGNKERALVLAKKANVGHSVFYGIVDGERRTLRAGTKDRILKHLDIRLKQ